MPRPGVTHVKITIFGDKQMRRQLLHAADVAGDMRVGLNKIADDMFRVIGATFSSQGRRYGGSWKALDPQTVKRKAAAGSLDPRILIASGALMRSVSHEGDPNQIFQVTGSEIILDSTLDYAEAHQRGNDHVPKRQFIKFYPQDRRRWVGIVQDELRNAILGV